MLFPGGFDYNMVPPKSFSKWEEIPTVLAYDFGTLFRRKYPLLVSEGLTDRRRCEIRRIASPHIGCPVCSPNPVLRAGSVSYQLLPGVTWLPAKIDNLQLEVMGIGNFSSSIHLGDMAMNVNGEPEKVVGHESPPNLVHQRVQALKSQSHLRKRFEEPKADWTRGDLLRKRRLRSGKGRPRHSAAGQSCEPSCYGWWLEGSRLGVVGIQICW